MSSIRTYDEYRTFLQSGDVLLFRGRGVFSTAIIFGQLLEGFSLHEARFTHVGLVIVDTFFDQVLSWESTLTTNREGTRVKGRSGVQASLLRERLRHYDGQVFVRQLMKPLSPDQLENLGRFRREVTNRPYEGQYEELFGAVLDKYVDFKPEDLSSLFCSEMVAEAHQRCGLLASEIKSNNVAPAEFTKRSLTYLQPTMHQLVLDDGGIDTHLVS